MVSEVTPDATSVAVWELSKKIIVAASAAPDHMIETTNNNNILDFILNLLIVVSRWDLFGDSFVIHMPQPNFGITVIWAFMKCHLTDIFCNSKIIEIYDDKF